VRVLLAEDDPISMRVLLRAMEQLGHECQGATNGEAAWELFCQGATDVIISDWAMPGMDGLELCLRVRAADPAAYTYFIFMTGHDDKQSFLEGMRAGADDYLMKPIDLESLEARMIAASRVMALHHRLVDAARTDPLTGVGNRLRLRDDLDVLYARVARYGHAYAVALCDVDHFKRYNDTHGHVAGDDALIRVAQVISAQLRTGDAVYRYGGEELLVLLPEQTLAGARTAMERVRAAVQEATPVTVSIGLATIAQSDGPPWEAWIARADEALYRAKAEGRNRICVWASELQ
jgi:two-component system, cell cycle response regulator